MSATCMCKHDQFRHDDEEGCIECRCPRYVYMEGSLDERAQWAEEFLIVRYTKTDAEILTEFKAACDELGLPYDVQGLIRHTRGNEAMTQGAWKMTAEFRDEVIKVLAGWIDDGTPADTLIEEAYQAVREEHARLRAVKKDT